MRLSHVQHAFHCMDFFVVVDALYFDVILRFNTSFNCDFADVYIIALLHLVERYIKIHQCNEMKRSAIIDRGFAVDPLTVTLNMKQLLTAAQSI